MFIDNLNLNHLRIFECVYRTGSMTVASQELHLTQSGVSQHMKAFEDVLGVRLFDRIRQRLVPTTEARLLFERCSQSLYGIEEAISEIKGGAKELKGTVRIGMPIEFGNNVIMPLLAVFGKKHPQVRYAMTLGFAREMNDLLLKGDLDFAFVDSYTMDKSVVVEKVYDEILDLCIAADLLKERGALKNTKTYFESLEYVEIQKDAPLLRMWFDHHLGTPNLNASLRATVMDVQGVARLVQSGVGAGVLPHHLVVKMAKLHSFKGCGKPLKNAISVAYLGQRTQSPAAQALLSWLKEEIV